jgi:hypothetical protein
VPAARFKAATQRFKCRCATFKVQCAYGAVQRFNAAAQRFKRPAAVQGSIRDIRVIRISNSYFKIVNPIASD